MSKLDRMDIVLTNPQVVYFAGQLIQGQLVIVLNDAMKMRGVRIKFRGKAHVQWEEGSGDNRRTVSAHEDYFDQSIVVFGKSAKETSDTVSLHAGQHVFPFQFVLPPDIPSSFEGYKHGCYVRYWIKGTIDKPWKFDHEVKCPFTIAAVLDLNTVPNAGAAVQGADVKTVCCCCCESGPVNASFRIDRAGYVPGEAVSLNAEITNNCDREIWSSKVKLYMKITYRTHGGSKSRQTKEVAKVERGQISAGGSDVWSGEKLIIPPLPPSNLVGCNIIDIDYYLELKVDVADTPFDLEIPLGIIIGTVPLVSAVQQYAQYMPAVPSAPPEVFGAQPITSQPAPGGYPSNLPPPNYSECVFGKVDIKDSDDSSYTRGNMNYAPAYTYYDWMSH